MISLVSIRDCKRKKEKVRMKKKALLTIGIIFSMVVTSFNMNFENVDADETEASEQYIVSTKMVNCLRIYRLNMVTVYRTKLKKQRA